MKYDPLKHHRRSIRLKGYDYSQEGAYCVTIDTRHRLCLFGDAVDCEMWLKGAGQMVESEWEALPERFPNVELDQFVIMPNHIHGIMVITDGTMPRTETKGAQVQGGHAQGVPLRKPRVRASLVDAPHRMRTPSSAPLPDSDGRNPTLGDIVGAWKSIVTDEYIRGVRGLHWKPFDRKLWQRNYYEHIIRDETDLDRIRAYVIDNPANWDMDPENPRLERIQ